MGGYSSGVECGNMGGFQVNESGFVINESDLKKTICIILIKRTVYQKSIEKFLDYRL